MAACGARRLQRPRSLAAVPLAPAPRGARPGAAATSPVYLTFDTGHMGVAPLVAEVLQAPAGAVTFFLANERTLPRRRQPGRRLGAWWRARAAEGHVFGSHT